MSGTISMMGQSTKEEYTNVYLKYDTRSRTILMDVYQNKAFHIN